MHNGQIKHTKNQLNIQSIENCMYVFVLNKKTSTFGATQGLRTLIIHFVIVSGWGVLWTPWSSFRKALSFQNITQPTREQRVLLLNFKWQDISYQACKL